jgi:bla regulator protein blaR1
MTIFEVWRAGWAAPLFNHLWQSTLVLASAWILTVLFRRNPARVRYGIWMLASLKFLVPFALLASLGEYWVKPIGGKAVASALYTAADEIGQPFQPSFAPAAHTAVRNDSGLWLVWLPAALAAIWLCGFLAALAGWLVRWQRMARIARCATPMEQGREFDALRRAESNAGLRKAIALRASLRAIEPGVFGLVRPVLLWPAGISAQMDDAQIASIMAHEVEHVRRRDNLTAAIHMFVQALFWFHPAVHWMGTRLLEERERACDEKVLELSGHPDTYAESILKVCAFCLEPPAPCVSGVSGSDLKQRIVRIMTYPSGVALSALRKCALCAAAIAAIAVPLGFGILHAMQAPTELVHSSAGPVPSFDVVSIKPTLDNGQDRRLIGMSPTGFTAKHTSLKDVIGIAYGTKGEGQIVGGPGWMNSEYFDIEAKLSEADIEADKKLTRSQQETQLSLMLQSMLADRFGLKTTLETRELPVYALVVAKGGARIKRVEVDPYPPTGTPPPPGAHLPRLITHDGREWTATAFPIQQLTHWLSRFEELGNRIVVDETGLTGNYDFVLNGVSMRSQMEADHEASQAPPTSIFTALEEQLGLRLESRRAPVEVVVVEHAEPPSPN